MINSNLIIMASVILGSAFLEPARPKRSPKRSPTTRSTASTPEFSGARSRTGKRLPKKLRQRLTGPGATPTPLPGPGATPTPLPGPAQGGPSMPGGHGKPNGPTSADTPTVPAVQDPEEFVFVPADRLGQMTGPLRMQWGVISNWSRRGINVRGDDQVQLRVAPPPAGKVAYVRCGVTFAFKHRWGKTVLSSKVGGVKKTQLLPKTGGILEFEVFPGDEAMLATLQRDASAQANKKLWWTITGCDRTVR